MCEPSKRRRRIPECPARLLLWGAGGSLRAAPAAKEELRVESFGPHLAPPPRSAGRGGAHLRLLSGTQSNHGRRHPLHHFGFWCFHFPCWGAASALKSSNCLSICRQDKVTRIDKESSSEWASLVAQAVKRLIPWRRKWHPIPVLLPGKFHGQRSLVGCSLWNRRVGHYWATSFTCAQSMSKVHTCWEQGSKQMEGCQVQPGLGVHCVYLIKARISSISGGRVYWFHWI